MEGGKVEGFERNGCKTMGKKTTRVADIEKKVGGKEEKSDEGKMTVKPTEEKLTEDDSLTGVVKTENDMSKEEATGRKNLETEHSESTSLGGDDDIANKIKENDDNIECLTEKIKFLESDLGKLKIVLHNSLVFELLELVKRNADQEYLSFLTDNKRKIQQQVYEYKKMIVHLRAQLSSAKERQRVLQKRMKANIFLKALLELASRVEIEKISKD